MQYLKIENPGIAPPECYTLLGCSMSRGSSNKSVIGQFGSGAKHAISLFLSYGLTPVIYCGNLKLHFYANLIEVNDGLEVKHFDKVYVRLTGEDPGTGKAVNRTEELSWTLQHGHQDWTSLDMALREMVSNAIDRALRQEGNIDNVVIECVNENQVRAKKGHTRIFVPYSTEVQKYHTNISHHFLHFSDKLGLEIIDKCGAVSKPKIYRKGVYVGKADTEQTGIFDYNFGEDLYIDECRNGRTSDMVYLAGKYLIEKSTREQKVKFVTALLENKLIWETTFTYFPEASAQAKREWKMVFESMFGNSICLYKEKALLPALSKKNIKKLLYISQWAWYEFFVEQVGITGPERILTKDEQEGTELFAPTEETMGCARQVWKLLSKYSSEGYEFPPIYEFQNNNFKLLGFYRDEAVYINRGLKGSQLMQTVLEEMTHHITNAGDCTRELQEFLFMVITRELLHVEDKMPVCCTSS